MARAEPGPRREQAAPAAGWLRNVLALALLGATAALCASLGMWQLDRAAERDALHEAIEQGRRQAPVALSSSTPAGELAPWRAATAQGRWSEPHTLLLENRNLDGRPGYWVATPLLLDIARPEAAASAGAEGGDATSTGAPKDAVLVLRGWLPRDMQAGGTVPAIPREAGPVQVSGELHAHVPRIFELWQWAGGRSSQLPDSLPRAGDAVPVVQNLDLAGYARASGLQLLPVVLAQTHDSVALAPAGGEAVRTNAAGEQASATSAPQALRREWPGPSLDSDQNRGYALQWFSFAAIAAIAALLVARAHLRRGARKADDKESP